MHMFWKSRAGVNEVLLSRGTVKLQHLCLLKAKALYSIPTIHTALNVRMMSSSRTQNVKSIYPCIVPYANIHRRDVYDGAVNRKGDHMKWRGICIL